MSTPTISLRPCSCCISGGAGKRGAGYARFEMFMPLAFLRVMPLSASEIAEAGMPSTRKTLQGTAAISGQELPFRKVPSVLVPPQIPDFAARSCVNHECECHVSGYLRNLLQYTSYSFKP